MRSFGVLVALFFAFVTISHAWATPGYPALEVRKEHKGNGTRSNKDGDSTKKECKQLTKLTKLTELAANQTKLDALVAKGKLNATEVADIQTKAAEAKTKLQTLSANTTLTGECAVIDAHEKTVGECKEMKHLEELAALANNQTAMDALEQKKGLNATGMEKLMAKIQKAETKLKDLQSNTTLTDLCAKRQQEKGEASNDASTTSTTSTQVAKSSAAKFTLRAVPYVLVPALGAIMTLLL